MEGLTFENAPTYERDGHRYLDRDAALVLAARIAEKDAALLDLLAERD